MAIDYESLDLFYLGKNEDENESKDDDELLLYKSAHLTTHAAILGMTGSGKTGLGIGILEEAMLDNIPLLIVDPKGDMGNLALAFKDFNAKLFEPWMDESEAMSRGINIETLAKEKASLWEKGLLESHQDIFRLNRYIERSNITIYTPGSSAGVSINILGNFSAPPESILDDADTFSSLLHASTTGLLSLIGVDNADDGTSPSYLLLSSIFRHYWLKGTDISMEALVGAMVKPPFFKLGLLDIDIIMPQKERLYLAMKLNGILASPTFAAWTSGEPLDIASMLYTDDMKPKASIFYLSHLSEKQRMFFVTMLLGRLVEWMRTQSGSSRLRAMLYMDEVFGYFPPSKNTPAKESMMLLLKQARAFGVSVVLSTQNPADLDYKALSNIGTWFIGKLQTARDRSKVLEGLNDDAKERKVLDKLISKLPSRTFVLKSARSAKPSVFCARWVLSYLKGPLSKSDIKKLQKTTPHKKEPLITIKKEPLSTSDIKPLLMLNINEYFVDSSAPSASCYFKPYLEAVASYRFYSASKGIDISSTLRLSLALDSDTLKWDESEQVEQHSRQSSSKTSSQFADLPEYFAELKSTTSIKKSLKSYIYNSNTMQIHRCASLRFESKPPQTLREFEIKVLSKVNEKLEADMLKLKERYAKKEQSLRTKEQRLLVRLDKEKADASSATIDTVLGFGMALFDMFSSSSKVRTKARRVSSTLKKGKKAYNERRGVSAIEEQLDILKEQFISLEDEFSLKSADLRDGADISSYPITQKFLKPRKSDISINELALIWRS